MLFESDEIVIFKDIKPASTDHFLVVPKQHIKDPKSLTASDIELVKKMVAAGKDYLLRVNGNLEDARLGFHWPPFTSISHLHLHVISPVQTMGWIASFIFRENSFWFVTADWLLAFLKDKK